MNLFTPLPNRPNRRLSTAEETIALPASYRRTKAPGGGTRTDPVEIADASTLRRTLSVAT